MGSVCFSALGSVLANKLVSISAFLAYNEKQGEVMADYYIEQEFAYNNISGGEVIIWIYEDDRYVTVRYDQGVKGFIQECAKSEGQCYPGDPRIVSNLGDEAKMITVYNWIGPDTHFLAFRRCNAIVSVHFLPITSDPEGITTYAQRLDKRLTPIVCR